MKLKLRIACAALLAATALPAFALQLGEIQVKSALNQPLVAAIPLHPKNLTELQGLTVGLASNDDFQRAGLPLTSTDQTLRFHVVTDNNGQKLILVTSSQPITDPYLDFLVQVNTREGKQVREFVVLLNPVIAAPAPAVQAAPVASAPAQAPVAPPAELPAPTQFPQPQVKPQPQPQPTPQSQQPPQPQPAAPAAATSTVPGGPITVQRGDTLSKLALEATRGTDVTVNQMMLAMQAVNPEAFYRDNINNLKAGAILRIPTRDQIDRRSVAAASAEVHRQIEAWRAAKPHPATVLEGAAAQAAANAAPAPAKAGPSSDHLTLAPPTGEAGGTSNRPGVAGGTGNATVTGLKQQLQADKDTLISLSQSNSDLESRVRSLDDISTKTGKLLNLKDATIAELQHKLATVQAGTAGGAAAQPSKVPASAPAHAAPAKPVAPAPAPWYMRPLTWVIAAVVVLVLILLGLFGRRRQPLPEGPAHGPLADPDDVKAAETTAPIDELVPATEPASEISTAGVAEPVATPVAPEAHDDPYGLAALRQSAGGDDPTVLAPVAPDHHQATTAPAAGPSQTGNPAVDAESLYSDDPIDTKLDLARAYLDMGDPVGARAMLEEVIAEGSQTQKDEAKRLLADAAG